MESLELPRPNTLVVCLGASAGGLRALEAFFQRMPVDSGCSFVVVQHLSPDFRSLMDDLLSRQTTMTIHRAEEGMQLEPNSIYLIPPRKLMTLKTGRLHLTERMPERSNDLPINVFLQSLASDQGARSVAVILSGSGSDGSDSLPAVHRAGGLVIVQSPDSAEFDGMPRSALTTGVADYVLSPDKMPAAVVSFERDPSRRLPAERGDAEYPAVTVDERFAAIFALLRQSFGLDFSAYKVPTVERRIHRRMTMLGQTELSVYASHLASHGGELDALYRDLLIGVTEFFRDPDVFAALGEQVYAPLMRRAGQEEVRVWVAGCATGEEAYTHAILLDEVARATGYQGRISIFATDAHRASIDLAALGIYPRAQMNGLSEVRRETYFSGDKHDLHRIAPTLRQRIVFAPHNLLNDPPFTKIDVISCRNLLIYLEPQAQERVLGLFHYALRRDAVLLLGLSEGLGPLEADFQTIDSKHKLFRKSHDSRLPLDFRQRQSLRAPRTTLAANVAGLPLGNANLPRGLLHAYGKLIDEHLPPGFILTADGDILHYIGRGASYLAALHGRAQDNILQRCAGDLRLALSTLIPKAARSRIAAHSHGLKVVRDEGSEETVDLSVHPLPEDRTGIQLLHVALRIPRPNPAAEATAVLVPEAPETFASAAAAAQRIAQLELELQSTKENLQSTVEELQTTNEELQAANEEMLAANEELQSTNEELHSVNEELYTVNAEFEIKNHELESLNADLDNLLRALDVATLFVDRHLRIRKFNPAVETFFHLLPQDIGRPVSHITYTLADQDTILREAEQVLATGEGTGSEVRTRDGHWLLKRVLPFHNSSRVIDGVVFTFTSIDGVKVMQDRLDLAMLSARLVWWDWDVKRDRHMTHSRDWCLLDYTVGDLLPESRTWFKLCHPDDHDAVRASLDLVLAGPDNHWECEHRFKKKNGEWIWVLNRGRVVERDGSGRALRLVGTTQDVQERHQARDEIATLYEAMAQTALGIVITDAVGRITYVNPHFTDSTGYTRAELTGQPLATYRAAPVSTDDEAGLQTALAANRSWRGELARLQRDDTMRWERVAATPVRGASGQVAHFIVIFEDITQERAAAERRAMQRANLDHAQKMETLGTLAGGIAHDFNNLLTAIRGNTSLALAKLPEDHTTVPFMQQIDQASCRAAELVRRILAFSRAHPPVTQALEVSRILREAHAILRSSIPTTVELEVLDEAPGRCILGDESQIEQLLLNLCTNAVQALPDAKGRLCVRLSEVEVTQPQRFRVGEIKAGPHLVLEVCDNGKGMHPDILNRIFEPFFTTKPIGQGTGLGLAILHNTVLAHHGAIAVLSVEGEGTSFRIYLPIVPPPAGLLPVTPAKSPPGNRQRIAVIDDDPAVLLVTRGALELNGYLCTSFADPVVFMTEWKANPAAFDLIVTDQTMPSLTGRDIARLLRRQGSTTPILILSGLGSPLPDAEIQRLQPVDFLTKPAEFELICATVHRLLQPAAVEAGQES